MAAREDRFANVVSAIVNTTADALTFTEMLTGISLGQGVGMLIDEIDYHPSNGALNLMTADGDSIQMGITTSNDILNLTDFEDRRIIHMSDIMRQDLGTAASAQIIFLPKVFQFFPPLIIAAPRLYLAMDTSGLSAGVGGRVRIYFRYIELTAAQYIELAEAFVLVG